MKLFSNFTLKIIAIIFMLMDHIYTFINRLDTIDIPIWFGYFGKLAAPIFFYLIVEGFFHTRIRKNYMKRLFSMGILMIGIDLILGISNNIFLSLGLGVALMSSIEYVKTQEKGSKGFFKGIICSILFAILSLFTEASIYGVAMILIFYFLREKKVIMTICYVAFSLCFLITMIGPQFKEAAFMWDYQWMMVFAIIPILFYNGKKGFSNKFVTWLFYFFYPIHLVIIVGLSKLLAM
jgi:hypothetical protein